MLVHLNPLPSVRLALLKDWRHVTNSNVSTRVDSFIYLGARDRNCLSPPPNHRAASCVSVTKGCGANYKNNSNSRHGSGFDLMPRCRRRSRRCVAEEWRKINSCFPAKQVTTGSRNGNGNGNGNAERKSEGAKSHKNHCERCPGKVASNRKTWPFQKKNKKKHTS